MSDLPRRFQGILDLARLPWFEVRDGRLALREPVGPVVDMHTHLAMAFVLPQRLDLEAEGPPTRHYLPAEQPFSLEGYANRNLTAAQAADMARDLTVRQMTRGGLRATHTFANLRREMGDLGVQRMVVLPIDLPFISDNAGDLLELAARHEEIVPFGCVQAWSLRPERGVDAQLARGAKGLKLHPGDQLFRPDWAPARRIYRKAGQRRMPILFHCGPVGVEPALPRALSQVRHYREAIARHPETRFVLGHSGALQWEEAVELARAHDNVFLETSSIGLDALEEILRRADTERIVYGSDWPFYHAALPLAKVLLATEGRPELRERVLWGNARSLLGEALRVR